MKLQFIRVILELELDITPPVPVNLPFIKVKFIKVTLLQVPVILNILPRFLASIITEFVEPFPCIVRFTLVVILLLISFVLLYLPGLSVITFSTPVPLALTSAMASLIPVLSLSLSVRFTALTDEILTNKIAIIDNIIAILLKLRLLLKSQLLIIVFLSL
ncbi:hypothetical protein MBFIL_10620 [Methanobrevibacter filiformis]|uniref:Uncharacterized protein n=1 Tax=Methanobrevibacter filiformis TaxID=55758 RepID=A0A166BD94_9EURY|nr:hypothetical protein MBFIL_10620 [Methanobrevibacter filiformis]